MNNNNSSTNNTDDEMDNEYNNNNNNNKLLKLHQFSSEELDYYKVQVDVMMLNAHHQLKFQRIIQSQKNEEELLKLNHQLSIEYYKQLSQIHDSNINTSITDKTTESTNHQLLLDTLNNELLNLNYLKQLKKIYKKYTLEIKTFVDSQHIINQIYQINHLNK